MGIVSLCCLAFGTAAAMLYEDANVRESQPWVPHMVAGNVALEQGRYAEAALSYEEAFADIPQDRAHELARAHALNGLGVAYSRLGKYPKAGKLLQEALTIRRKSLGDGHPEVAALWNNIGTVHYRQGRYREALRCYRSALAIDEAAFGPSSAAVANDLNNVASASLETRQYSFAERMLRRAIDIGRSLGSPDKRVPDFVKNLACVLGRQRHFDQAKALDEQVLTMQLRDRGARHPSVGLTLEHLATMEVALNQCSDAERHAQESVLILNAALGEDHPRSASANYVLARAYECMKQRDLAEKTMQHVLDIDARAPGAADERSAYFRMYARLLRSANRKTEAKHYEELGSRMAAEARRAAQQGVVVDVMELQSERR